MLAHLGTTIAGRFFTSWRVSSQEMPPWPTTIAARSTVTGTPVLAEQALDLATRTQVGRHVAALLAETAHVDDLPHALLRRSRREGPRRLGVLALEVGVVEGVHEVVGDLHAGQRLDQRVGVVHVPGDRFAWSVVRLGVAGHRADLVALLDEGGHEAASDEAGGAGDEDAGHVATLGMPPTRALPDHGQRA